MTLNCGSVVEDIVKEFAADRSRLLDIVEQVQHRFGHVSDDAIRTIATGLGIHLSRSKTWYRSMPSSTTNPGAAFVSASPGRRSRS